MARSRAAIPVRPWRVPVSAVRTSATVLLVVVAAACCPAPLTPASVTPTAFAAVVVEVDATTWVAEGPGGERYRISGIPPGAAGVRVYVSGTIAADGSLDVERVDPLATR